MRKIKLLVSDNVRMLSLTSIVQSNTEHKTHYICADLIAPQEVDEVCVNEDGAIEIKENSAKREEVYNET